jgi:hypothetical protein
MNFLYVVWMALLPGVALGQDVLFELKKDQTIVLQQNVKLVRLLTANLKMYQSYDKKKVVFIPTIIELKAGKGMMSGNHVCQYSYNEKTDAVSFKALKTSGFEFDFDKKKVTEKKNQASNTGDHFKPVDLVKKVKDQEKAKIKPTIKP